MERQKRVSLFLSSHFLFFHKIVDKSIIYFLYHNAGSVFISTGMIFCLSQLELMFDRFKAFRGSFIIVILFASFFYFLDYQKNCVTGYSFLAFDIFR